MRTLSLSRLLGVALPLLMLALAAAAPPVHDVTLTVGYGIQTYTSGPSLPTSLAAGPDDWIYVSQLTGTIKAIKDTTGDGLADTTVTFATGYSWTLGIAFHKGWLYLSKAGRLIRLKDTNGDHVADVADSLFNGLPTGQHQNNGIAFRADTLYVTVGSDQNIGTPGHPWSATILRFTETGSFIDVFAEGIRNPYDLAFHGNGSLFAPDNGPTGDPSFECYEPPDELNWIRQGLDYGFPECNAFGHCADVKAYCNPQPCGNHDCEWGTGCDGSTEDPLHVFDPHSAPTGLAFGDGSPGFGVNELFVCLYGQDVYVAGCPTNFGHELHRVTLQWTGTEWSVLADDLFVDGLASPVDVLMGPDESLYILDFGDGNLYKLKKATGVGVDLPAEPAAPRPRLAIAPNPAYGPARLHWLNDTEHTPKLTVIDVAGNLVRTLPAAAGEAVWDLRDDRGVRVRAGIYVVRAETPDGVVAAKLTVLD